MTNVNVDIPDHHNPRNEECGHNIDPRNACDCKKKRNRKPYRKARVHDNTVNYGVRKDLILEIHPNGRLVIREKGRKMRVETTVGVVYERLLKIAASSRKR